VGHRMRTGRRGESLAAEMLEGEGWIILARCWRDGPRELDLVAMQSGTLLFVEVKTRRAGTLGDALAAVTPAKRREIERAAAAWLRTEGARIRTSHPFRHVRFDVVAVLLLSGAQPRLAWVKGAWVRGDREAGGHARRDPPTRSMR
jgi:putative endonuclease